MMEIKANVFTSEDRVLDVLVEPMPGVSGLIQTSYVLHHGEDSFFIPSDIAEYIAKNWGTVHE